MLQQSRTAGFAAWLVWLVGAVAISASCLAAQQAGLADLILHSGKILTVDENFSVAQAVAIRGNQITAVGANADILKLAGSQSTVLDLKGRTVIPGLIDTHRHPDDPHYDGTMTPEKLRQYPVDWRGVRTKDDVLNQIKGLMDRYQFKPGEWIYFVTQGLSGMGGSADTDQASRLKILFEELNRWELDKVTPNNPIAMSLGIPNQNGLLINSKALDILMAQYGDFVSKYGRLWLDAGGRPEGHIEPPATRLILAMLPEPDPADVGPQYKMSNEEMNAMGLTTFSSQLTDDLIKAYQWLESRGELTIRIPYGKATDFGTFGDFTRMRDLARLQGTGTDKMWVNSVAPSNVDGSGSRSCMSMQRQATYGAVDDWWPIGQCHMDPEYAGGGSKARTEANYYREWGIQSGLNGLRWANTHMAGERTVSLMLSLVDQVQKMAGPNATKGWAFDHCTFVNPRDFKEAARLGVTFSCAPKYIRDIGPQASRSYGDEVANTYVVPVKSLLDAGVKVVFEGDNDVYVWGELELLQTRKDKDGKVWGPQERLDRATVLKMATRWAADYVLRADKLGSLEPGKWADLVVLDQDYMTIPVEQIHAIQPQLTVFDGKMIFLTPAFSQEYNLKPAGAIVATFQQLNARRKQGGFNPSTF